MAGSATIFAAIAVIVACFFGQPATGNPLTASIQFSSVLASNEGSIQISCKNSVRQISIGPSGKEASSCPMHTEYWLKHLVLVPEQQTTLEFVPGYAFRQNGDWCWQCDLDWNAGRKIVTGMLIFPNNTSSWTNDDSDSIAFQLRQNGIYERIRYGQGGEFEMYVLVKKWMPKEDFSCTEAGRFRDPFECNKFHVCEPFGTGFVHNKFTCPEAATVYCEKEDKCGYESECPCHVN